MTRSIRHTLTWWYVGIFTVVLSLFSATLYLIVWQGLTRHIDRQLELQADAVARAQFAFWRAERAAALSGPGNWMTSPADTFRDDIDRGRLDPLVERWAGKTGQLHTDALVEIVSRDGRSVGASDGFQARPVPIAPQNLLAGLQGRTVYSTVGGGGFRLRLVLRPVISGGVVLYLVRVGAPLGQVDDWLRRLRTWLLLLVPLTIVGTSTGGWFLATRALSPVGQMIAHAKRIRAERLTERVAVPTTRDELEQLATTLNEMLARLEEGFRRLRQFSAASSHELRTPLTVMRGEIEVALRKPREPDEYERVLRAQLIAIDEMTHVVEELLLLARSEAADHAVEWRPVELAALADETCAQWTALAQEKSIRVEAEAHGPVWVRGEGRLLSRLLTNLVDNALRHTPAGGRVIVRVTSDGPEALLSVEDTGPGIPPEEWPHIFDRFFKPRSEVTGSRSTGLGLGLCRWIAEFHRGSIHVANAPGRGAVFTIRLPRFSPA